MNRAIVPVAAAAVLGLALFGASTVPVQQAGVTTAPDDDRARVAVVCPTVVGGPTVIAGSSPGGQLLDAPLADPDGTGSASAHFSGDITDPVVVSAPRQDPFSATTRTAAASGTDRGLSMASCTRPGASQWFAGVTSSATGTADVVLMNADAQDAAVDIAVYGPQGRMTAPGSRGIIVAAHSRRVVPLGPLFTATQPVSLEVSTSSGRVAAMVRQRMLRDDRPAGSDWLPATAPPATAVVIPGLPAGKGGRDLVVVNPGERTASIAVQVLGADGARAVPGFETVELPPRTSRLVALGAALAGEAVGLRLSSEQKITAAVISGNGGDAGSVDISTQVATAALSGPGVLALAPGQSTASVLQLAGGGPDPVAVRVLVSSGEGGRTLLDRVVQVPGLADTTLTLPRADDVQITVEPRGTGPVHATVGVRIPVEGVTGVASLAILPGTEATALPPLRQDPRVGS
ncbi:MAG: DUF5719 family protein [Micropruina sp.]|uniref:DUF5719 family protein n=1 Tax=Micropruina sp. TaxID=2737536 RepID=UPI0039E34E01